MSVKKVGRIVERQNLKQENRALKNILQHAETIAKANRLLEETFRRGWVAGQDALTKERANAKEAEVATVAPSC